MTQGCHKWHGHKSPTRFSSPRQEEEGRDNWEAKIPTLLNMQKGSIGTQKVVWCQLWNDVIWHLQRQDFLSERKGSLQSRQLTLSCRAKREPEHHKPWKESHDFFSLRWRKAQVWQHQKLPSSLPKRVPVASHHQLEKQEAARACLGHLLVSLLRRPAGLPTAEVIPAPSKNWGGKHNPYQTQTLTCLPCHWSRVLNPVTAAPCPSGNNFLWNTVSNTGGDNGISTEPKIKLTFSWPPKYDRIKNGQ